VTLAACCESPLVHCASDAFFRVEPVRVCCEIAYVSCSYCQKHNLTLKDHIQVLLTHAVCHLKGSLTLFVSWRALIDATLLACRHDHEEKQEMMAMRQAEEEVPLFFGEHSAHTFADALALQVLCPCP
jgi:hypothetical protein